MDLVLVDTRSGRRRTLVLGPGPTLLGRGVDCDVVLPSEEVAEQACELHLAPDGVELVGLDPNGVTLNDRPVKRAHLQPGDVVRVGPFHLVFAGSEKAVAAFADEAAPRSPPVAPRPPPSRRSGAEGAAAASSRRDPARSDRAAKPHGSSGIFWFILVAAAGFGGWRWWQSSHAPSPSTPPENRGSVPSPSDGVTPRDESAGASIDGVAAGGAPPEDGSTRRRPDELAGAPTAEPPERAPATKVEGDHADRPDRAGNGVAPPSDAAPASEMVAATLARVKKLLADEQYSRCRWVLSQLTSGDGAQRVEVERLRRQVEEAGAKAGEAHLKFVSDLNNKGWILPAIKNLDEERIQGFVGFEVWYRMLEKADEIEQKIDDTVPAERRPMLRRKHAHSRPAGLKPGGLVVPPPEVPEETIEDFGAATTTSNAVPYRPPAGRPTPGKPPPPARRARDPLKDAVAAIQSLRFSEASAVLDAMPTSSDALAAARRTRLRQWAAGAAAAASGGSAPAAAPDAPAPAAPLQGEALDRTALEQRLSAARAESHSPREWLNLAWLALALADETSFRDAIMQAASEASLKGELDSAIAFQHRLDSVPVDGFDLVDGQWLSKAEQASAGARSVLASTLLEVAHAGARFDPAAEKLRAAVRAAPEVATELLLARAGELADVLDVAPEKGALAVVRTKVEALVAARKAALDLIFDAAKYKPADGDPEQQKAQTELQHEIDRRVDAVRDFWGNEFGKAPEPTVQFTDSYIALVRETRLLDELLREQKKSLPDRPELLGTRLLPLWAPKISVRNYALDLEERKRIDADRDVRERNNAVKDAASTVELELLNNVNFYREMMGRPQLTWDPALRTNALATSDMLAATFKGTKDGEPTLTPVTPDDGPKKGGEQYLKGRFTARQALQTWCKLPKEHRNLLDPRHRSVGVGNVNPFWTATFGLAAPAAK